MHKFLLFLALSASAAFAQYNMEPGGAPPSGAAPAVAGVLQKTGTRVLAPDGSVYCELWFRNAIPSGPATGEKPVAFPTIPRGALLGVISFPKNGADRRGQPLKPGVYTLRYQLYPVYGDHQGVAPQRDFLLLVPAAADADPNALLSPEATIDLSRKASGTPHPAVLSIEAPAGDAKIPGVAKEGENDWVLNTKIGSLSVGIILVGAYGG